MRSNTFWPIILILAGVLFLLSNLNLLPGNAWDWVWPAFLILLGVNILFRRRGVGSFPALPDSQPLEGAASARRGGSRLAVQRRFWRRPGQAGHPQRRPAGGHSAAALR
ncbi:MAG: hypothetical protein HY784_09290 [Chloroflexi bacterium]|nr:hypothetical protein [Chloroflexota bacterium]